MPPQPQKGPTFSENFAFAKWLMQFPALTVMVYVRRDLGFRLMNPLRLMAVTGVLIVISVFAQQGNPDTNPLFLVFFAVGALILGIGQRIKGWWKLNRGIQQHSYYIGTSLLRFRFLPDFVRRNRRVERFIDPIFFLLIGLAIYPIARALACWLVISALSLRYYEFAIHERDRDLDLDTIDGLINAENQSQTVEQYEDVQDTRPPQQATGIPTGLGQDVREHIRNRKNKR